MLNMHLTKLFERKSSRTLMFYISSLQQIGKAFLPSPVTSKVLLASTEDSAVAVDSTLQKAEAVPESNSAPPKLEAAAESAPEVNAVPKPEVKAESPPGISRPLSPFPYVNFLSNSINSLFSCFLTGIENWDSKQLTGGAVLIVSS